MLDTREHILQTALSLFITKSYKAVTMSDMEKATGLTKGAFYHYFRNKEEIFVEVIDKYYLSDHIFDNKVLAKTGTLKENIEFLLKQIETKINKVKQITQKDVLDPYFVLLIIEAHEHYPEFLEKSIIHDSFVFNKWEEIILRAKERGEIKPHLSTNILVENIMAIGMSMMKNIFKQKPFESGISTLRLQYEQFYNLVRL